MDKNSPLGILAIIAVLLLGSTAVSCKQPSTAPADQLQATDNGTQGTESIRPTTTQASASTSETAPDAEPNRLINEKSPYLLQHATNPVDWHPWGEEAFAKARQENKPIFLSIGYSTCHWCHVMEEESFADPQIAKLLNDNFVPVIVDREERPDIDSYYMNVAAILAGSGGWPLNIIMTPDQKPFYAATYIPRESRFGRVGMLELISQVQQAWANQDQDLLDAADQVHLILEQALNASAAGELAINEALLERTYQGLAADYDAQYGGFGTAPKFPAAHRLFFLLRYWKRTGDEAALQMVETTLQAMRRGGVYDQLGFGFHRYATDAEWLIPHFEKMLYDQALLSLAYSEAYQATAKQEYAEVAQEIITYVLRDMTDRDGGFYAAEDADSEGEEGKFYFWTADQIREVLAPEEAELAIKAFNIAEAGNYLDPITDEATGTNILYRSQSVSDLAKESAVGELEISERLEAARQQLFSARAARVRPHKDDKILTDWNGLMIAALARAGRVLGEDDYTRSAEKSAGFVLANLRDEDGRLLHSYWGGEASVQANLDDYAFLIWGLLELYEATFDTGYLESALDLAGEALTHTWDEEDGGFYFTADDGESTLGRQKLIYDGAIPSGNSVMMLNLIRLGRLTANPEFDERALATAHAFADSIEQEPSAYAQLMMAVDFGLGPSYEIVIIGEETDTDTQEMLAALYAQFMPNKVVLLIPPEGSTALTRLAEYTKYYASRNDRATAYVCQNYYCELPTNDIEQMLALLGKE